jgi:hypothetical protein
MNPTSFLLSEPRPDPVFVIFDREDIEKNDHKAALQALKLMAASPQTVREYARRLVVSFSGYDNDPREIWSIPSVRLFVHGLSSAFPYWFHFCSHSDRQMSALIFCYVATVDLQPDAQGQMGERIQIRISRSKLLQLLQDWFGACQHLYQLHHFPTADFDRLTGDVEVYLGRCNLLPPTAPTASDSRQAP